jgi:hypothetical protein
VFVAVAVAIATPAAVAASTTTAVVYRPFAPDGASRLTGPTKTGHCWTSSETTPRRDAWRCMTGNYIYDPCFSSPRARSLVLCPLEPWRNRGIKLHLTRALPTSLGNHGPVSVSNQPWALELYDGRKCVLAGGASSVVEGHRLNYFCAHDSSSGLWGFPDRGTQPWTVYTASYTATHLSERAAIRDAWI